MSVCVCVCLFTIESHTVEGIEKLNIQWPLEFSWEGFYEKKIRSFSILYQIVKIINYIKFNSQSLQFCSSPRACMTDLGRVPVLLRETSVWSRFGVDGITPGLCSSEGWDRTRCLPPWRGFWCHQPGQVVVARSACPGGQMQSDCGRSFERRVDDAATGLNKLSLALTVPEGGGYSVHPPLVD